MTNTNQGIINTTTGEPTFREGVVATFTLAEEYPLNMHTSNFSINSSGLLFSDGKTIARGILEMNPKETHHSCKYYSFITDVDILVPNKVVECTFYNGKKYKAVCSENDTFSLEMAITICLCKFLLSGSSSYNAVVRYATKLYNDKLKRAELDEQKAIEAKEIAERKKAKRERYRARKAAKAREEQISIQEEAIVRAMKRFDNTKLCKDEYIEKWSD